MHRIDTSTRAQNLFGAGKDGFTDGVPSVTPPTNLDAAWFNALQEEVAELIETMGYTLETAGTETYNQLITAIQNLTENSVNNRALKLTGTTHAPLFLTPRTTPGSGVQGDEFIDTSGVPWSCLNAGAPATWVAHDGLLNIQVFATNGTYTYTPTAGTRRLFVEVVGAGGGGGGAGGQSSSSLSAAGGGGGAGGYATAVFTLPNQSAMINAVVVGTGGAGGTGSSGGGTDGSAGAASSFNSTTAAANGGAGGPGGHNTSTATTNAVSGGLGGTVTHGVGSIGAGGGGAYVDHAQLVGFSGTGGCSYFGGGGPSDGSGGNGGPGAGGGGALRHGNTSTPGGAGGDGEVRIWEFGG